MLQKILIFLFFLSFPFLTSATEFITPNGVTKELKDGMTTLTAAGQIPILIEKKNLPPNFEKIEISGSNYSGPAFFVWQPKGQALDPNRFNMGLTMVDGVIILPAKASRENFELIGVIIPANSLSFQNIEVGALRFNEKLSRLTKSHNPVLPSTINLILPKYWGSTPISLSLGILVLMLACACFFYKKKWIIGVLVIGWGICDIFYITDQWLIMKGGIHDFVSPSEMNRSYYDLGTTYQFGQNVRKYGAKNVDYFAPREWPFYINFLYHAYPTRTIWQGTGSEMVAIYNQPFSLSGKTLKVGDTYLSGEYSLLEKFSDTSYLFKKQ